MTLSQDQSFPTSPTRPSLSDEDPIPTSSLLSAILPLAVQARFSHLPSIRRSFSAYGLRRRGRAKSFTSHCRTGSHGSSSDSSMTDDDRPSSSKSSPPVLLSPAAEKGAGWKYANQGLNLLEAAVTESRYPEDSDKAFARQLYIHALSYLLKGLPRDLGEEEIRTIQLSMPPSIQQPRSEEKSLDQAHSHAETEPSLLHRLLASGIIQIFLFFQLVLPYVKIFLQNAYKYERAHHISEKILATSIDTADNLSKKSLNVVEVILTTGNGRVGELLAGMLAWWIEGITGGIHEGVGEGMTILGARGFAASRTKK
ncbi:hypothetical protein MMC12_001637 [Toensbergia leucococca]|nr:hypothetical protein [Toensbergia leucococca]